MTFIDQISRKNLENMSSSFKRYHLLSQFRSTEASKAFYAMKNANVFFAQSDMAKTKLSKGASILETQMTNAEKI